MGFASFFTNLNTSVLTNAAGLLTDFRPLIATFAAIGLFTAALLAIRAFIDR